MQIALSENQADKLTDKLWERWQKDGIHSRRMTYLEVHNLAEYFLKVCKQQEKDYQEFDFYTLIDSNLNFYENRAEINNQLDQPATSGKEHLEKLKDYLTDEQIKEYTTEDRTVIEQLQQKSQTAEKQLKQIRKAQEAQQETQLDTNQIKEQIREIQNTQDRIMSKLENLPNLDQQIEALLKSKNFKDLGTALKPFTENKPEKPPKPKRRFSFPAWLKPKQQIKPLDAFAGAMGTLIYLAASGWILSSFSVSWGLIAGLSGLWLSFVVVFRLVVGGILD
jgi:Mg2+ and Co2+ transporter CorA